MRQLNGCSTPALKSSAAKQWIKEELAQTKKKEALLQSVCNVLPNLTFGFMGQNDFLRLFPHLVFL